MLANYCTALADETKKKLCEKKKQQSITISPHKLCNTISYVKGSLVFCRFFFSPLFCIRDEDENLDEDGLDCIGLEEVAKMRTRLRKSRRSRLETAKKTIAHSTHTHTHERYTNTNACRVLVLANSILGRNIPLSILQCALFSPLFFARDICCLFFPLICNSAANKKLFLGQLRKKKRNTEEKKTTAKSGCIQCSKLNKVTNTARVSLSRFPAQVNVCKLSTFFETFRSLIQPTSFCTTLEKGFSQLCNYDCGFL